MNLKVNQERIQGEIVLLTFSEYLLSFAQNLNSKQSWRKNLKKFLR